MERAASIVALFALLGGDLLAQMSAGEAARGVAVATGAASGASTGAIAIPVVGMPAMPTTAPPVPSSTRLVNLSTRARVGAGGMLVSSQGRCVAAAAFSSACLLAITGLFVKTLQQLRDVDLGYRRDNILRIPVVTDRALEGPSRAALALRVLESIEALPEVEHVTVAELRGMGRTRISVDGYEPQTGEDMFSPVAYVGPGFFETYALPILRGRSLTREEALRSDVGMQANETGAVVVTNSFAKKYFGADDPIGHVIRLGAPAASLRIVGVVRDASFYGPRLATPRMVFLPLSYQIGNQPSLVFAIAGKVDVVALAADLQAAIRNSAPQVAIRSPLFTEEAMTENLLIQERAIARVAGFFSVLGLLLASVGLYGVLAYEVSRRTREIGVRIALGARALDVQRLFVGKGLRLALLGAFFGLAAATGFGRVLTRLLYNVSPADPVTLAGTAALLLIVALVACWLPARRATKVDPMVALRAE